MKLFIIFAFSIPFTIFAQLPSLIPYREVNKWGFADSAKKIKIKPIYDEAGFSYNDYIVKYTNEGKPYKENVLGYYVIKDGLKSIVDPIALELDKPMQKEIDNENAPQDSKIYDKVVSIDQLNSYNEKMKAFKNYDDYFVFNKDFYLISKNGKNAITDKSGNLITKYFDSIILKNLSNEVIVKINNKYGKINYRTQKETVPIKYEAIFCWNDIYTSFKENKKFGMYANDKIIVEAKYDNLITLYSSDNAFILNKINGKLGLFDGLGKIIISPLYDTIYLDNYYGTIWLKQNNRLYLYNKTSNKASTTGYEEVESNCNPKLIAFKQGSKFGFINGNGKIIFKPIFDSIEEWSSYNKANYYNSNKSRVLVKVTWNGKSGYVDYKGNQYWKD